MAYIVNDDGSQQELTQAELDAINQAREAAKAEQEAAGNFEQLDDITAAKEIIKEMVTTGSTDIPDSLAVYTRAFFPAWDSKGHDYAVGDRVTQGDILWRCLQAHKSQADWVPMVSPSLWTKVLIVDPDGAPPEWEQPESTNPYNPPDRVTHNGKVWGCVVANNVWEPGVYGWEEVVTGE